MVWAVFGRFGLTPRAALGCVAVFGRLARLLLLFTVLGATARLLPPALVAPASRA